MSIISKFTEAQKRSDEKRARLQSEYDSIKQGRDAARLERQAERFDERAAKMSRKHGRGGKRAAKAAERAQALHGQARDQ